MKKIFLPFVFSLTMISFYACSFPTKVATTANDVLRFKTSYSFDIEKIFTFNCSPCHIPAKGGTKKSFDNYTNVKENIDEILRRVQLSPTDKDFMPSRQIKISDNDIALLKKWKADGLLEK